MAQARKPRPIVDGFDHIEVASIDSFPASDPPGWIETAAHPCLDEDVPADRRTTKSANKTRRGVR